LLLEDGDFVSAIVGVATGDGVSVSSIEVTSYSSAVMCVGHGVYPKHDMPLGHSSGEPLRQRLEQDVAASARVTPQKNVLLMSNPPVEVSSEPMLTGVGVVRVALKVGTGVFLLAGVLYGAGDGDVVLPASSDSFPQSLTI
jgi:hypothetical protein